MPIYAGVFNLVPPRDVLSNKFLRRNISFKYPSKRMIGEEGYVGKLPQCQRSAGVLRPGHKNCKARIVRVRKRVCTYADNCKISIVGPQEADMQAFKIEIYKSGSFKLAHQPFEAGIMFPIKSF